MIKVTFTDGSVVEYLTAEKTCPSIGDGKTTHLLEKDLEDNDLMTNVAEIETVDIARLEIV
jgi:hypothetical protein